MPPACAPSGVGPSASSGYPKPWVTSSSLSTRRSTKASSQLSFTAASAALVELASLSEVRHAVASLRLALEAALVTSPTAAALGALAAAGNTVQELVLDPLVLPRSDEVVVVADGPVASTPWALLPDLAGAKLVVATSADAALRPPKHFRREELRVLTLAGPDLRYAEEEAEAVERTVAGQLGHP